MRGDSLRWSILAVCVFSACGVAAAPGIAKNTTYTVTPITPLPDASCEAGFQRFVYARRINEAGVVIGHEDCFVATGDPEAPYLPRGARAMRWSAAIGAEVLPTLSGAPSDTYGRDINDLGVAIGRDFPPEPFGLALLWPAEGGVSSAFSPSQCDFALTLGEAINNRGSLAGSDQRPNEFGGCSSRWVLKLPSGEEIEGPSGAPYAMNDHDVLVGDSGQDIVRWSPAAGAATLFSSSSGLVAAQAWSINDRNEVVGEVIEYDGETGCTVRSEAKFWAADGSESNLPLLRRGVGAGAFGINNQGLIVGNVQVAPTCDTADASDADDVAALRAVVWTHGKVANLNTLVPKAFSREYQLTFASGVNERGQITVRAIRRGEAPVRCPIWDYDFPTGEEFYNAGRTCLNEYAFLLTPR